MLNATAWQLLDAARHVISLSVLFFWLFLCNDFFFVIQQVLSLNILHVPYTAESIISSIMSMSFITQEFFPLSVSNNKNGISISTKGWDGTTVITFYEIMSCAYVCNNLATGR